MRYGGVGHSMLRLDSFARSSASYMDDVAAKMALLWAAEAGLLRSG